LTFYVNIVLIEKYQMIYIIDMITLLIIFVESFTKS